MAHCLTHKYLAVVSQMVYILNYEFNCQKRLPSKLMSTLANFGHDKTSPKLVWSWPKLAKVSQTWPKLTSICWVCLPVALFLHVSLSVNGSVCLSVLLSFSLFLCLPVYLSLSLAASLSISLCLHLRSPLHHSLSMIVSSVNIEKELCL